MAAFFGSRTPLGKNSLQQARILGALIRDIRDSAGLSQWELADRLGRPQSFVSKVESGDRYLRVLELLEVAKACGASPPEIVARLEQLLLKQGCFLD